MQQGLQQKKCRQMKTKTRATKSKTNPQKLQQNTKLNPKKYIKAQQKNAFQILKLHSHFRFFFWGVFQNKQEQRKQLTSLCSKCMHTSTVIPKIYEFMYVVLM